MASGDRSAGGLSARAAAAWQAWRWLSVLHARLGERLERDARDARVVPFASFEVLAALAAAPAGRVRLGELVDTVLLTKAGLTRLLDRLEAAGLVRREPSEADGRGADAVLTPAGRRALAEAFPVYAQTIDACLARHLTIAQAEAIAERARHVLAANDWLPDARPVALTVKRRKPT